MADTEHSKCSAERHEGSSPSAPTMTVIGKYNSQSHWTWDFIGTKENPYTGTPLELPPNSYRFIIAMHFCNGGIKYCMNGVPMIVCGKANP